MFQFTHPGKGATGAPRQVRDTYRGFNSRTLGRVRRTPTLSSSTSSSSFNSRTLGRVRRGADLVQLVEVHVSIHAPWEGCDRGGAETFSHRESFNSRTLGRVRPGVKYKGGASSEFQFTHPGKGATGALRSSLQASPVSIHAPWEGCDFIG